MSIKMNKQQKMAFDAVMNWSDADTPRFYLIKGYAGVGKTTMAMEIARELDRLHTDVAFCAPTNKAVRVIDAKLEEAGLGHLAAMTVHQTLYTPDDMHPGQFIYDPTISRGGLLVVDEASMLTDQMIMDLRQAALERDLHVLCMGDSFQLPPVYTGKAAFQQHDSIFDLVRNQSELTQVMRQAGDSHILEYATALRSHQRVFYPNAAAGDVQVVAPAQIVPQYVADLKAGKSATLIVWKNMTRIQYNGRVRAALFGQDVKSVHGGEPVMGLANGAHLVNGETVNLPNDIHDVVEADCLVGTSWKRSSGDCPVGHYYRFIAGDQKWILFTRYNGSPLYNTVDPNGLPKSWTETTKRGKIVSGDVNICTWGYAITAHKSQGSQWDKVYITESMTLSNKSLECARWLYTAVTRAAKELVLPSSLTRNGISWDQIQAAAAPFMKGGKAPEVKQVVVQKEEVKPEVTMEPAFDAAACAAKLNDKFGSFLDNLNVAKQAVFHKAEVKTEAVKEEPVQQEKVDEAPDVEPEDVAILQRMKDEKAAEKKARKEAHDKVAQEPMFVPEPKKPGEDNISFLIRVTGFKQF